MDILEALGIAAAYVVAIALLCFFFVKVVLPVVVGVLFLLPVVLGFVGCVAIWKAGYSNAGVLFLIAMCLLQYFWLTFIGNLKGPSSGTEIEGHDWRDAKIAVYDKKGNITGYKDKE